MRQYVMKTVRALRCLRVAAMWGVLLCLISLEGHAGELQLKYLGAAGWDMREDGVVVLVDPYLSRVPYGGTPPEGGTRRHFKMTDEVKPDTALIDGIIDRADFILVHHAHPDHIFDVPYIARKTGAKVLATETASNLLRAAGVPDEQIYTVAGGEDYQFGKLSIRVVPSLHSALSGKHYFDSSRHGEDLKGPVRLEHMVEGGSLMFLVRFPQHTVLTMGSMNFIERELEGLAPDVLLAGAGSSRQEIHRYTERLLNVTEHPRVVLPTHWDNFTVPYEDEAALAKATREKAEPFAEEARAASPQSKVIIPAHLVPITISD